MYNTAVLSFCVQKKLGKGGLLLCSLVGQDLSVIALRHGWPGWWSAGLEFSLAYVSLTWASHGALRHGHLVVNI